MSQQPILSIIVPTHNRRGLLEKNLAALSRQTWSAAAFEVLVVADACTDDTAEMVTAYATQAPYSLHLLSHQAKSAAATRNLGAANARGRILMFLDDDIVGHPGLVKAHMDAQHPGGAALGYSKPVLPSNPTWFQRNAHCWWEDTFREMGQRGHRFSYRNFFSGNVSLPSALFQKVGGFDTSLTSRLEDYELGLRLLKAGSKFCYVPDALGYHYDTMDLPQWLRRIRQEGGADVQIAQRHPELRTRLLATLEKPYSRRGQLLRTLAFAYPQRGDWLERLLLRQVAIYEQLRLRDRWRKAVDLLRDYNYLRGIVASFKGQKALANWLQEGPMPPAIATDAPIIDLAALPPIDALQELLQQATTLGVRLALQGMEVLTIPPQPGTEPLQEEHLHSALRALAEKQFIPALAMQRIRSISGGSLLC